MTLGDEQPASGGEAAPDAGVTPPLADPLASALTAAGQPLPTERGPDQAADQPADLAAGGGDDGSGSRFERAFDDPLDRLGGEGPRRHAQSERTGEGSSDASRGFDERLDDQAAMEGPGPTG